MTPNELASIRHYVAEQTPTRTVEEIAWLDQSAARLGDQMTLEDLLDAWHEPPEIAWTMPIYAMDEESQRFVRNVRLAGAMAIVAKS